MTEFESLFRASHGAPIRYQGETLLLMDRIPVPEQCRLSVILRSAESEWPQAVRLKTKGCLVSQLTGAAGPSMVLWAGDLREPHPFDCRSQSREPREGGERAVPALQAQSALDAGRIQGQAREEMIS